MQGRLLPKVGERIQSFPGKNWHTEFKIAEDLGFELIELTIETSSLNIHPIMSVEGQKNIRELSKEHNLPVEGICCDVFMEQPLIEKDGNKLEKRLSILKKLIDAASMINSNMIELPMLDKNSLNIKDGKEIFNSVLKEVLPLAENLKINILLEADMAPTELYKYVSRFDNPYLGINYDCGNSTWFGFSVEREIPIYHKYIKNVHIKDCTRRDYSVPLGSGETDFDRIFKLLRKYNYQGNFILQAARQEDNIKAAREYLKYTYSLKKKYLN